MTKKIFLSYRRDDSSGYTGLLYSRLTGHYGPSAVFRDIHSIHPLDRFREVIQGALAESAILFVVMSKQWTQIADANGTRRITQPDDVVCWEIASALSSGLPVLPILVGGARMPKAADLPKNIRPLAGITAYEMSDHRWEHDFDGLVRRIAEICPMEVTTVAGINPFSSRGGIRDDIFFHDRDLERRMLRDFLRGKQNCQLVGPRRIGKSSMLRFVQRHCTEWCPTARLAYLDLQDPRCFTLAGWLKEVAHGLRLGRVPATLSELMEGIDDLLMVDIQPVLCLDEFGEMAQRTQEFSREVFLTLRACGQRGMSILTASPKRLSEFTNPRDDTSPFFNTFPVLPLRTFTPANARAYVDQSRPDIPSFTEREKERILEFAQGHPLALQCACFYILAARESGEDIAAALARAAEDCRLGGR
jgi:hypothetical protein